MWIQRLFNRAIVASRLVPTSNGKAFSSTGDDVLMWGHDYYKKEASGLNQSTCLCWNSLQQQQQPALALNSAQLSCISSSFHMLQRFDYLPFSSSLMKTYAAFVMSVSYLKHDQVSGLTECFSDDCFHLCGSFHWCGRRKPLQSHCKWRTNRQF